MVYRSTKLVYSFVESAYHQIYNAGVLCLLSIGVVRYHVVVIAQIAYLEREKSTL